MFCFALKFTKGMLMLSTTLPILACVDGSIYTESVCAHAAWASQQLHAPLHLLHVQAPPSAHPAPTDLTGAISLGEKSALLAKLAQVDEERSKLDLQKGKLILAHATAQLVAAGVEPAATLHRRGSLVETIGALEAEVQLIVLGKRGEHADFARLHLGSNLERVVRAAHKPILIAARTFKPITRVALAFDGGTSAQKAVAYLASNPLLRGSECHLLQVGRATAEAQEMLTQAASTLAQAGLHSQTQVQPGDPAEVIPAYVQAEGIELLVMGAYSHSKLRQFFIGSTTNAVLRSCPIPLLIMR